MRNQDVYSLQKHRKSEFFRDFFYLEKLGNFHGILLELFNFPFNFSDNFVLIL